MFRAFSCLDVPKILLEEEICFERMAGFVTMTAVKKRGVRGEGGTGEGLTFAVPACAFGIDFSETLLVRLGSPFKSVG